MSSSTAPRTASPFDGTLRFVPIDASLVGQPLRLCVAVRVSPEGDLPSLVLIRSAPDARVYLGAQVDRDEVPREWLEIWVQSVAGLHESVALQRDYLSNQLLDQQWVAAANLWRETESTGYIATGWEDAPPRPAFIDTDQLTMEHPKDPAGGAELRLCMDAAALARAGLPGYAASLHRYWSGADQGGERVFYAASPGAPITAAVREHPMLEANSERYLPFNPEGGRLLVRHHPPLSFEDYVDLLGGKPWRGTIAGPGGVRFGGSYDALSDWDRLLHGSEHLFLGGRGRSGRFIETFCLRLNSILAMIRLASRAAADRQLPLLNLTADSFRLELGAAAPGLPLLWSARMALVVPGQAAALPIKATGERYFLPLESAATSIYRSESVGLPARGRGTVRLRRIVTDSADLTSIEGTLVSAERLGLSPHDLLWIKLPLSTGTVDLFARVDTAEGLARGEGRFRTVPHRMGSSTVAALRAAEGNTFSSTEYESIPMLSTPCDLYALGVLAVRALLVNAENRLGVALDETLSLARELSQVEVEDGRFGPAALQLTRRDPRWVTTLGPQRLSYEPMTPEAAFAHLPEDLWWETVATIARLFPGNGAVGYCRDFSDVSNGAIEKVFDRPAADFDSLLIRARGLLFSDWNANREIAAVLDRIR